MGRLTLVLGGARSGKSRFAQRLATTAPQPVVYVATAEASDAEMHARIARHRAERPSAWQTIELPRGLDRRLGETAGPNATLLVDCLSVWLSNELLVLQNTTMPDEVLDAASASEAEQRLLDATGRFVERAIARDGETIVVSNEVGSGIVPAYPLGRIYRDILGRANQAVARHASAVYLVVAGIGVDLRGLEQRFGSDVP